MKEIVSRIPQRADEVLVTDVSTNKFYAYRYQEANHANGGARGAFLLGMEYKKYGWKWASSNGTTFGNGSGYLAKMGDILQNYDNHPVFQFDSLSDAILYCEGRVVANKKQVVKQASGSDGLITAEQITPSLTHAVQFRKGTRPVIIIDNGRCFDGIMPTDVPKHVIDETFIAFSHFRPITFTSSNFTGFVEHLLRHGARVWEFTSLTEAAKFSEYGNPDAK